MFGLLVFGLLVFGLLVSVSFNGDSIKVLMPEQWRLRALRISAEVKTVERWGVQLL